MTQPNNEQHREMLDVLKSAHAWIDSMQVAGIEEKVIMPAIHMAVVERYLRAGGVLKTVEVLQSKADMVLALGPELLTEIQKQGR